MRSKLWRYWIPIILFVGCQTVPITGRKQFNLVSDEQAAELGRQAYEQILDQSELSDNQAYQDVLDRVGTDIAAALARDDFKWAFNVLEGDEINAFALPGGKVAFWEGIMPICGDANGVAVVMGHEIAHVLAGHGGERMSQAMGLQVVQELIAVGLGGTDPQTRQQVLQFYGVGAQVGVLLPFGRKQESEADHIGLILMAKAGYDPRAAVEFWERMEEAAGGGAPPEFLSTHPAHETRIEQIRKWLPEALEHYQSAEKAN